MNLYRWLPAYYYAAPAIQDFSQRGCGHCSCAWNPPKHQFWVGMIKCSRLPPLKLELISIMFAAWISAAGSERVNDMFACPAGENEKQRSWHLPYCIFSLASCFDQPTRFATSPSCWKVWTVRRTVGKVMPTSVWYCFSSWMHAFFLLSGGGKPWALRINPEEALTEATSAMRTAKNLWLLFTLGQAWFFGCTGHTTPYSWNRMCMFASLHACDNNANIVLDSQKHAQMWFLRSKSMG